MAKANKFSEDTAPEQASGGAPAPAPSEGETKTVKSIVPTKYAGKYKSGQRDALGTFIDEQCVVDNAFSFDKFFDLCKANGIPEDEVNKYKVQVDAKVGGAAGRARMTLRNRLTPLARKGDGMKGLDGKTYDVKLPPVKASGAAAPKTETASETTEAA